MTGRIRRLAVLTVTALATIAAPSASRGQAQARASKARSPYAGPSCNPFVATLGAAFMEERKDPRTGAPIVPRYGFTISLYPERAATMGAKADATVSVTVAGRSDAPFVYLLNGLGSPSDSGYSNWLMDFLHQMGFTVVSIPSPFSDVDAYGFSRYLRPGLASVDVPDVMALVNAARKRMAAYGYRARESVLMGVSLGAFHGAMIQADPRYRDAFTKYILINPPLDLRYGLRTLDSFAQGQGPTTASDRKALLAQARERASAAASSSASASASASASGQARAQDLGDDQLRFLIGVYLRLAVQDMAVASQDWRDDGVFWAPKGALRDLESRFWSIQGYFDRIAFPFYSKMFSDAGRPLNLDRELSVWSHLREAPRPSRVQILHSMDDFISDPNEIPRLKTLPVRSTVSRCGGHVGALPYRDFTVPLANFLREP